LPPTVAFRTLLSIRSLQGGVDAAPGSPVSIVVDREQPMSWRAVIAPRRIRRARRSMAVALVAVVPIAAAEAPATGCTVNEPAGRSLAVFTGRTL